VPQAPNKFLRAMAVMKKMHKFERISLGTPRVALNPPPQF
jgi:hypothetical protein